MNKQKLFDALAQYRVVPVIAIDDVESAVPMADALIEGGLPVAGDYFSNRCGTGGYGEIEKRKTPADFGCRHGSIS